MNNIIGFTLLLTSSTAFAADWPPAAGSLSWPIANGTIKDTTIFFGHHDSAGVATSNWCNKQTVPPYHIGLDIAAPKETQVIAIDSGVVKRVGSYDTDDGYYVVVESGTGKKLWTTLYGHLNRDGRPAKGQIVKAGLTPIGTLLDMSANNDIPHLHLGIRALPYGSDTTPHPAAAGFTCASDDFRGFVDPLLYLKSNLFISIDDGASSSTGTGTWSAGNYSEPFYFGFGFKRQLSSVKGKFTYSFSIATTGTYDIFAKWPLPKVAPTDRDAYVIYRLMQGNKLMGQSPDINQGNISQRGKWASIIGSQYILAGNYKLEVSSHYFAPKKYVTADGILILKQ